MVRYPKAGKGGKWTVKELDAVRPEWKCEVLSDGGGLSGEVRLNNGVISIVFRFAFKWQGKVAWHYCGSYPTNDMSAIREERDKARTHVKSGVDPRSKKKADKIVAQAQIDSILKDEEQKKSELHTFCDLYDCWIVDGVNRADGNKSIIQSMGKHALPILGKIELRHLAESDLRDVYKSIIAQDKVATAVELSKDIGQMLRWAEKRKPWRALLIEGNPAELVDIQKLVPVDYSKERTRYLSVDEIKLLKTKFDLIDSDYKSADKKYAVERPLKEVNQLALWLCLSTLCRIGELLKTEWHHVDIKNRQWRIPAENTKGERGKKNYHIVYLSDFALKKFSRLKELTGKSQWVFPSRDNKSHIDVKSISKQVGDRQLKFMSRSRKLNLRVESNSLVLGDEEWTPHDLRRTGSTMMQKLKISREIINLCQNHVVGSKVDRVYLLAEHEDEMRVAWQSLGQRLVEILGEDHNASNA